MDVDLADRVAELEERARRFVLATTGSEGWQNYIQLQLLDERQHFNDLLTELIAQFERQILDEVKAMLDQVLATRVRGTYQASASYARGDVVALDGGSFLARRQLRFSARALATIALQLVMGIAVGVDFDGQGRRAAQAYP